MTFDCTCRVCEAYLLGFEAGRRAFTHDSISRLLELLRQDLKCMKSGNPCGTDTWTVGYECECERCQLWLETRKPYRASGSLLV